MEGAARGTLELGKGKNCIVSSNCLPQLTEATVHIWTWRLDVERDAVSELESELSESECRRVRRYASHRIARRFIVRRGMLRRVLGLYLHLLPHQVQLFYNAHGKPLLADDISLPLQFNMSDSGELAALAVGTGQPLGIDIEQLRPLPDWDALAINFFSESELNQLSQAAATSRTEVFFRLWTRREAISKAEGVGLRQLSAQLLLNDQDERSPPAATSESIPRLQDNIVHELTMPDGYVGALAIQQEIAQISYIDCVASAGSLQGKWMADSKLASGRSHS